MECTTCPLLLLPSICCDIVCQYDDASAQKIQLLQVPYDLLVGADGAGSVVRSALQQVMPANYMRRYTHKQVYSMAQVTPSNPAHIPQHTVIQLHVVKVKLMLLQGPHDDRFLSVCLYGQSYCSEGQCCKMWTGVAQCYKQVDAEGRKRCGIEAYALRVNVLSLTCTIFALSCLSEAFVILAYIILSILRTHMSNCPARMQCLRCCSCPPMQTSSSVTQDTEAYSTRQVKFS